MELWSLTFSVLGFVVSVLGFTTALYQINKIKKSSTAAFEAAENTRNLLIRNACISDISISSKIIDEIQNFIRNNKVEFALLKVKDLKFILIQLKHFPDMTKDNRNEQLTENLSQLSVLRDILERKIKCGLTTKEMNRAISALSDIADSINELVGQLKYTEGEQK
jgi:hypothetical protein